MSTSVAVRDSKRYVLKLSYTEVSVQRAPLEFRGKNFGGKKSFYISVLH